LKNYVQIKIIHINVMSK